MTKEDIIFNIKYRIMALKSLSPKEQEVKKGNLWELEDLLAMIENGNMEDEPQGLDEAAELSANGAMISRQSVMYNTVVYNTGIKCFDHSDLMKQFKAGAKWMAEQGLVKEQEVEDFGNGATIKAPKEKELDSIGATLGDKVIVQIRKA